ncbi:hypothetical protein [Niveispirillum sp. KHB5.9]|uniref:hypothetical protein n=1 Tax=Niveispirillum sp. KHB5.9 TaxID=3400269 RepID=UPI003A8B0E5F
MANRYWFRPKTHGYGAVPASWEGWAVNFAYSALILLLIWGLPFLLPVGETLWHVAITLMVVVPATLLLLWVTRRRTGGELRWRGRP